jgi:hypothetical protein
MYGWIRRRMYGGEEWMWDKSTNSGLTGIDVDWWLG